MHYTSCADGVEGVRGFQVSAASPDAPWSLVQLVVRHSVYERSAEFTAEDLPTVFGYVTSTAGWAVFRSVYAGTDVTGRPGNYFVHAVLDSSAFTIGTALPIDLCPSGFWAGRPTDGTALPRAVDLQPAPAPDTALAAFLAVDNRLDHLAALVSAVQTGLGDDRPTVLVCAQGEALLWLTALARSLPHDVALQVTFLSYTPWPLRQDVVLSCTTPTSAPRNDSAIVCDVGAACTGPLTPYAAALRQSWAGGWSRSLATYPIGLADLDIAAAPGRLACADEATLLRMAALARRMGRENAALWSAVVDRINEVGITDLDGWLAQLPDAPPALARHCLDAIVAVSSPIRLPPAAIHVLRDRLADLPEQTAWRLHLNVAVQLAYPPPAPRGVEVALARHGRSSRVAATQRYAIERPADLPALGALLWADPPDHAETSQALDLADGVLRDSGLAEHFLAQVRVVQDEHVDSRLAAVAARVAVVLPPDQLIAVDRALLQAIVCLDKLGGRAPLLGSAATHVGPALALAQLLPGMHQTVLASRLRTAVETGLRVVADAGAADQAVQSVLDSGQEDAYEAASVRALAQAAPQAVADTFTAWARMRRTPLRESLLHRVLPAALRAQPAEFLARVGATVAADCQAEWARWRVRHQRRSLLNRLFRKD
jgi:hypothetical protein